MTPLLALLCLLAPPQEAASETFGHSFHGEAFDEGPRQAAYRMEGMSPQVHMPIAGLDDEAQAFFDQGLTQLHGFWYFESERSFRQVAKLAPECAMAYWGMAMANVENLERAVGFTAEAVRFGAELPRYEELWVEALANYYLVDEETTAALRAEEREARLEALRALVERNEQRREEEGEALDLQLVKDLGTIVHEFPDDLEAKALLAVQIWLASRWGEGVPIVSHTAVDALLDPIFARAPMHPAHHYRVHLWDREAAERALPSAAALGASAAGIAHQWHMAGHIYAKLDRHAEASWQQEASSRVDHAHMRRDGVMPFLIHNYGHNQEWLSRSLAHQGRLEEALEIARNLAELPRHPAKNRIGERGDIAWYARLRLMTICEEHGLWERALELADAGYMEPVEEVRGELLRLRLLGRALYRLGRIEEADAVAAEVHALLPRARAERARELDEAEDEALERGLAREGVDEALEEATRAGTDLVRAVLDLERELEAERLLAEGDAAAAVEICAEIERFPKTLLADLHVAAGELDEALELLREEVEEHPHRLETLGRLVLALRAADDLERAEEPAESAEEPELADDPERAEEPDLAEELAAREAELAAFVAAEGPLAQRLGLPAPRAVTVADFFEDFGARPALETLGPKTWSPYPAPGFDLPVAGGGRRALGARPTLVVFYLGFGCLHCVEQLEALAPQAAAFAAAGIDVVAIGTDDAEGAAASLEAMADERFPFPLLADPELEAFRAWRCHDDFEEQPLHGTFLVDAAGRVRWQDISFEPFTEIEWLLGESRRLLALPASREVAAR